MREDYRLLTPENVELQFDVAGLGSRLAAAVIDYAIIVATYLALILAAAFVSSLGQRFTATLSTRQTIETMARVGTFLLIAFAIILGFLAWWGYFLWFELAW